MGRSAGDPPRAESSPEMFGVAAGDGPAMAGAVQLLFEVARVDLPILGPRHSPKVWNHVDELRLGAEQIAHLARNGLRAGIVRGGAWAAVQAIFDAAGARRQKNELIVQSGLPLTILVGAIEGDESIFTHTVAYGLAGKTFHGGDKLLQLDYAYQPAFGGATDLRVGLEVRRDLRTSTWERQGDVIREVRAYDRHVYDDLVIGLRVLPGETLILGPSEQSENDYLVGSRFFTGRDANQQRIETLYLITPRPHRFETVRRTQP